MAQNLKISSDQRASKPDPAGNSRQKAVSNARERPLLRSTKDTEHMLGIGHTKLYELLAQGHLTAVKIGRKTLITNESIERLIEHAPFARIGHRLTY